jgi:hypothetical protein
MREFYSKTGISRGTLESNTGITETTVAKFIASYPEVSPTWLLTGKGSMLVLEDLSTISEHLTKESKFNDTKSPSCEKCKMYEELIVSLRQQIELQTKLISHLEKNKSTDESGLN